MATSKKNNQLKKLDARPAVELTMKRIEAYQQRGELVLPADYNPGNALNAAYLQIQETKDKSGAPAPNVCTPASVATALLDMVVQGLDPAKKQCYFIVYGDQLTLLRSYQGTIMAAKRFGGVKNVFAQVVYSGDSFEYEIDPATGIKKVKAHKQTLDNIDGKNIVAAYASVVLEDGTIYQEIMTIDEIKKAWSQGATGGNSPAHQKFPQEMAKKTVINRACKNFINTSTDSTILADSFNRTTENDYKPDEDKIVEVPESDITTEAFDQIMGSDTPKEAPVPKTEQEQEQEQQQQDGGFQELTDEEKAEIEAAERAAAEAEQEAEG